MLASVVVFSIGVLNILTLDIISVREPIEPLRCKAK